MLTKWVRPACYIAIDANLCIKFIDIGTDGASTNTASAGPKGLVEKERLWLESAFEDALKSTYFDLIDNILPYPHYIYVKFPKKCTSWAGGDHH